METWLLFINRYISKVSNFPKLLRSRLKMSPKTDGTCIYITPFVLDFWSHHLSSLSIAHTISSKPRMKPYNSLVFKFSSLVNLPGFTTTKSHAFTPMSVYENTLTYTGRFIKIVTTSIFEWFRTWVFLSFFGATFTPRRAKSKPRSELVRIRELWKHVMQSRSVAVAIALKYVTSTL